jgi:hypothetical protein
MKSISNSVTSTGIGGCRDGGRGWGSGSAWRLRELSRWEARCRARVEGSNLGPGSDNGSSGGAGRIGARR